LSLRKKTEILEIREREREREGRGDGEII